MDKNYKPEGYNALSPYLIVQNAQQMLYMLVTVFDGEEKRKFSRPDGSLMHAEVQIDDSIIMFSQATKAYPPTNLWLHVYVPDVQQTYKKAIEFGCDAVEEPIQKQGDPDCRGSFKDGEGNYWAVSTQL